MAATASQRGKPQSHLLHRDFSSPTLNPWRIQRSLQPKMLAGERRSAARPPLPQIKDRVIGDDDGGLKELREKLLGHLREAADKLRLEMPPISPPSPAPEKAGDPKVEEADRPWNLRLRTNAKRAPAPPPAKPPERTMRLRSEGSEKKKKKEKRRLSISLLREEIEEDLFALTGSRPKRRPKKRPRSVQLQLDGLFPGIGLSEITITPELYKVDE